MWIIEYIATSSWFIQGIQFYLVRFEGLYTNWIDWWHNVFLWYSFWIALSYVVVPKYPNFAVFWYFLAAHQFLPVLCQQYPCLASLLALHLQWYGCLFYCDWNFFRFPSTKVPTPCSSLSPAKSTKYDADFFKSCVRQFPVLKYDRLGSWYCCRSVYTSIKDYSIIAPCFKMIGTVIHNVRCVAFTVFMCSRRPW